MSFHCVKGVLNQYQVIDEAKQPPFVGKVSAVVGLLVEADVELLDERGIVHVLLVLQLLLQLLIGLLDAGEGVVEADVHIDVLH